MKELATNGKKDPRSDLRAQAIIEERERLAREFHDGMSQLLGCLITKTATSRVLLENGDTNAAETQLREIEAISRTAYDESRLAIFGLKAANRNDGNLKSTLDGFVTQYCEMNEEQVMFAASDGVGAVALPGEARVHLIHILQEALTNVRRHASAERVVLKAYSDNGALVLEVVDDGIGFNPSEDLNGSQDHYGLGVMQERGALIGAEVTINSSPGKGTQVQVTYPLSGS